MLASILIQILTLTLTLMYWLIVNEKESFSPAFLLCVSFSSSSSLNDASFF